MNKFEELARLGQSIWYDFIRRDFLLNGEFKLLIDQGLRGMTSNPSIFEKAITGTNFYDDDILSVLNSTSSIHEIYEVLVKKDIGFASGLLKPVFEKTQGLDGYVSLEVNPLLASETKETIDEAKRLYRELGRKNVMIKVPATKEGLPAVTELIASGINVNVTLIFSKENYLDVANAYIRGLEELDKRGGDLNKVASVASFFVSRIETAVDKELDNAGVKELQGKIAVSYSKIVYEEFLNVFSGDRWEALAAKGANIQRLLWASTSTKNPAYRDTLYVDELIGPNTVNTVPPSTLTDFLDHGTVEVTVDKNWEEAHNNLAQLNDLKIDILKITNKLQKDGVESFSKSFKSIINSLEEKCDLLKKKSSAIIFHLGEKEKPVIEAYNKLVNEKIVNRIWEKDFTVWSDKPSEISNRLGWLDSPTVTKAAINEITAFVESVRSDGFTTALLMGMGGSSLAPEVFRLTFGAQNGYLDLHVLDSTDPAVILKYTKELDLEKTLFVVSTKSGGTVETLSFMKYFYNLTLGKLGKGQAGKHFVAITDPGSKLETIAGELNFRKTFLNDPNIGGRFSALSFFGIIPAALIGADIEIILKRAENEVKSLQNSDKNLVAFLGVSLGELANIKIDKLTFISSPELKHFQNWVEQLIAESTGKNGKGILPVVNEAFQGKEFYGNDRVFVVLSYKDDTKLNKKVESLILNGFPVIEIILNDKYDLGSEFLRWEFATAITGWSLKIQPFDQPDVESAKVAAREMVKKYLETGQLPREEIALSENGINIYGNVSNGDLKSTLNIFLDKANNKEQHHYIAIQAFITPNEETARLLNDLRIKILRKYKVATAVGFGPRFLHSTGQLHKGDGGNGLFIQFIADNEIDAAIPDNPGESKSSISFGTLIHAQASGDRKALNDAGREVITFDLGVSVLENLKYISNLI